MIIVVDVKYVWVFMFIFIVNMWWVYMMNFRNLMDSIVYIIFIYLNGFFLFE